MLALIVLSATNGTAAALAADGLPPGVPVPAWAVGKKVHFDPAERQSPRLAAGATATSEASPHPLASSAQRLQYFGGVVENEPRLMLIFMGEQWEFEPALRLRHELEATAEGLSGSGYPCNLQAHYYFEYGTSISYGNRTAESVAPAAWGKVKVAITIAGLQHSTPYHWRVVVTTSNGTAQGVDHEFTIPYYVEVGEEGVSKVGFSGATLSGEVQPAGVEAKYYFEYGTTEAYGSSTAEESAGSGKAFVEVSAVLTDLELDTLYHFRLVASSSRGTTVGEDKEFRTLGGKPVTETWSASFVHHTEATLEGVVDPKGVATSFYFEYGPTSAYGLQTTERSAGEGASGEEGKTQISDLAPNATYHYRIVATNSYGISYGADETFSTGPEPFVETEAAKTIGYNEATLSGTINPHGATIGYYFEYGTSQSYGKSTDEFAAGSGTSNAQEIQTVHGLTEHTTYHFRLVGTNSYGTTYGSDQTFTTGVKPFVQTDPPASVGPASATLTGTLNPHGTEVEYYFEYGLMSEYGLSTAHTSAGSGNGDVEASQAIADLIPGTAYHYRLVARYGSVKRYGSEVTFTTTPLVPVETAGPASLIAPLSPIVGPVSIPIPGGPARHGLSLHVTQNRTLLLVLLRLESRAARMEVDATAPDGLGAVKRKGHRVPVVVARAVRTNVEAGQSRLVLSLDAKGRRALRRRRHLTLTVTVAVTSSGGERQTTSRTLAFA